MKKLLVILLTMGLIIGLSGCMKAEEVFTINGDGSGEIASTVLIDKDAYDSMIEMIGNGDVKEEIFDGKTPEIVSVDGVQYYKIAEKEEFKDLNQLKSYLESEYKNVYVNETGIRFVIVPEEDVTKEEYEEAKEAYASVGMDINNAVTLTLKIKMPEKILKVSNVGTVSQDGSTAEFNFDVESLLKPVDIMVSTATETVKPTVNVTSKKTYKSAKTVNAKDASGIEVAKYKLGSGKYYTFTESKTFTKNGKYTVVAQDYYGNKTVKTFTIKDTTRPKVSGAVNKKTYTSARDLKFTDNCAVKTVKFYIDGERIRLSQDDIKNGVTADESGSYKIVVTDVNGNSRTVRFKIK